MGIFQRLLRLLQVFTTIHYKSKYGYKLPCGKVIDPLNVYKQLLKSDINKYLKDRKTTDELKYIQAEINLCTVIRNSFDVKALNEKGIGYSDQDCLDVLADFLEYIEKKDQKAKTLVTSPQLIEPTVKTIPMSNDCGCT